MEAIGIVAGAALISGGGGGGGPEPTASFDFIEEVYTVGGNPVVLTDNLAADGESGAEFDPADVVAGGLRGQSNDGSSHPAIVGDLFDAIMATVGSTVVIDLDAAAGDNGWFNFDAFNSPTWDADVAFGVSTVGAQVAATGVAPGGGLETENLGAFAGAGRYKVAFNFSKTELSASVNGGATVTLGVPDVADWTIFTKMYMDNFTADYIRSIRVYELQLAADLPNFSAIS